MGVDASKDLAALNFDIPTCLRSVHPFLYDAQRGILNLQKHPSGPVAAARKRLIISNINHAFKLLNMLNSDLPADGKQCLENYSTVRDRFASELGNYDRSTLVELAPFNPDGEAQPSHEILIAEADELMTLASNLSHEGMKVEASQMYHTACIYYKVMMAMVPTVVGEVTLKLQRSSQLARLTASLSRNFVREHFADGRTCADVYEVHGASKLGKGSYGSVYLSTHRITGDERAVKVMNVDRVTSYYLRKLHTEIEILKSVDHPNIIKIQDVFFGKRSVYLVTDLCRGGELFELLNSGKNQGFVFKEDRVSRLMKDMISSVHYLHQKGIVHRDLKLENFLFEDRDSNSPLILIDFGLSKTFEPGEVLTQRVGSCYYTAPEVLNSAYDHRCDIWSLGVLCYMLLTGSPPFHGKDVEDVYDSILKNEATYPEKKFRHISSTCMDFLRRLLVKDVNLRLTGVQALAHPFISGATQSTSAPPLPPPKTSSFLPRPVSASSSLPTLVKSTPITCKLSVEEASAIMESIEMFVSADPLTKLILIAIAHSLPCEMVIFLREEFKKIDTDCNGTISFAEFSSAFSGCRSVLAGDVDLTIAYAAICIERSHGHCDEMSYHEYIAASMCKRVEIDDSRALAVFDLLDADNSGVISVGAIRNSLGEDIPVPVLEAMISCVSPMHNQGVRSGGGAALNEDFFIAHWSRFMAPWSRALAAKELESPRGVLSRGLSHQAST